MINKRLPVFFVLLLMVCSTHTLAQKEEMNDEDTSQIASDWFLRDPATDQVQGTSTEKAYSTLLQGKPSRKVRVAVIDSGIDIDHEDLKDVIWTNEDEIPGNGIDDDKNGYADDIHGWNFIGGKNGSVNEDTYEVTREYVRLKRYDSVDEKSIKKKQRDEYELWKTVKADYQKELESNTQQYELFNQQYDLYVKAHSTIS